MKFSHQKVRNLAHLNFIIGDVFMRINLRNPLIPLSLLILIDHIGFGILFPILVPVFMEGNGILGPETPEFMKSLWYNVTLSVFPVALFFGATLLGSLSDQLGRKKVLIFCLLGAILSYFLAGVAIDLKLVPLLILSRFLAGLTAGSMPIAQAAIIDISNEKDRSANLGIIILAASLGFLLGPMIGGFFSDGSIALSMADFLGASFGNFVAKNGLVSWFNFSTPFFVASLLALINLCFLIFFFKDTYIPKKQKKFNWMESLELTVAPFKTKNIRFLSLIFLLIQFGWGFYFQFVSVFLLKRYQYSSQGISIFMTLMGVGFAFGSCWALRILTKYFEERKVAIGALMVIIPSSLITVCGFHPHLNWLAAFLMGTCMAIVYSLMVTFYSKTVSEDKQGWVMGVSEAVISIAFAITPLASIYLENWDLALPLQLAAIMLTLGTFLFLFWKEPKLEDESQGDLAFSGG